MVKAVGRGALGILRGAVELIDGAESRKMLKINQIPKTWSAIFDWREPKSGLGQVFNSKLGGVGR
jgi:hypothetical protein